jgi:hypothetical protein
LTLPFEDFKGSFKLIGKILKHNSNVYDKDTQQN